MNKHSTTSFILFIFIFLLRLFDLKENRKYRIKGNKDVILLLKA